VTLGKRYIAVCWDRENGEFAVRETYPDAAGARMAHEQFTHPVVRPRRVLEVDLDQLVDADASDEDRAMHAEAQELHWTAERERLWPALSGVEVVHVVWAGELVERDIEIHSWPPAGSGGQHTNGPNGGVLLIHKPTGVAAVSTEHRSQFRNRNEAMRTLRKLVDKGGG